MQSLNYAWDGYGDLTERQDTNQSLTETFGYDDLNRLTGSTVTNPAANGPTLGFGYDAAGNITSKTASGVTSSYTYDSNHPYAVDNVTNVNGGTYTASYDADGNMTSRNGSAITWTPANLPASTASSLGSSTFNYGPEGSRYYQAQTFNGVTTDTTYIAGGLFEVVASSTGTEYRHNIIADGQIIAVHTITAGGAASTSYLHYDQLGSINAITNGSGSVIQQMSFDAFGNRRLANNWDYGVSQATLATMNDYTNRGYTDQEQLDNLSLVDMNGRVYDPTVGRFISADPTVSDPGSAQGFNRYAYVYNNPLEYTDPSGFLCKDGKADNGQPGCDNQGQLSPIGVSAPYFPIGDNTDEPGATNLSNCGCLQNAPSGNPGNGPSPGGNPDTSSSPAPGTPIAKVPVTSPPCAKLAWCEAALMQSYVNQFAIENIFRELGSTGRSSTPYMPISPAESQDALQGNVSDFWALRLAGKDPYAQIGCAFWCNASIKASLGAYWETLAYMGTASLDAGLIYAGDDPNTETVDQIGSDIMTNYMNFINGANGDLPTITQFDSDVHQPAFNQYGIPMSFFGGTLLFGQPWEARLTAPIWCPQCSKYPSLYGGGD